MHFNPVGQANPQLINPRRCCWNIHLTERKLRFLTFNPQPTAQCFRVNVPLPAKRRLSQPRRTKYLDQLPAFILRIRGPPRHIVFIRIHARQIIRHYRSRLWGGERDVYFHTANSLGGSIFHFTARSRQCLHFRTIPIDPMRLDRLWKVYIDDKLRIQLDIVFC